MLGKNRFRRVPLTVTSFQCIPAGMGQSTGCFGSNASTTTTANRAHYMPIYLDRPMLVQKVLLMNGATASGNVDVGIYSENGTKIWSSGATAQAGTNAMQVFTPTAFTLPPGTYYLAVSLSNGTGTVFARTAVNDYARMVGACLQASAHPLPSTFTLAAPGTAFRIPYMFISGRTTI